MNEDFEKDIKLFPVKKLLSSLGYTVVEKDDTQCIIYDNQENGVGTVSILDDIKFEIDGVGMRVFGHYDYNKAFNCIKKNINPQWDVKFAIDGANVNHSYIEGDLNLVWKNNQHDSDEPDYIGHLQLKVTNSCYDQEITVDMMNDGKMFGIENMITHEGEADNLRISAYPDAFFTYANHDMIRLNETGEEPYKREHFAIVGENNKDTNEDVYVTYLQIVENKNEELFKKEWKRTGPDNSEDHLDDLDYVIDCVHPEIRYAIDRLSDDISSSNYRILDKFAGLVYNTFNFYNVFHLTGLKKEELKIYGPKAETK